MNWLPNLVWKAGCRIKFPAKINLTCRIQLIAKPHICRIQFAVFNSTRRKCCFGFLYRFGDSYECRRTNKILRKFLASLKGQHTRWQKTAIKHCRNVPAFSSFSRHEVLHSSKIRSENEKIPSSGEHFWLETTQGRRKGMPSSIVWLDSRWSWTFRPSANVR